MTKQRRMVFAALLAAVLLAVSMPVHAQEREVRVRTFTDGKLAETYILGEGVEALPTTVKVGNGKSGNVEEMRLVGPWPTGALLQQRFIAVWEVRDPKTGAHIWLKNWQKPASEWITLFRRSSDASYVVQPVGTWLGMNASIFPAFEKQQLIEAIGNEATLEPARRARWLELARGCPANCRTNVSQVEFRVINGAGSMVKYFRIANSYSK